MIDPQELRLKNIVTSKSEGEITIERAWQIDEGEELFPVPITDERLIKFGYVKQDERILEPHSSFAGAIIWERDYKDILFYEGQYHFVIDTVADDYEINFVTKEIEFVHQLQNIYFVWNDKEIAE